MNIDELTLGQIREVQSLLGSEIENAKTQKENGLSDMIGKKSIIRTYSAGVWFGEVAKKSGGEIILKNARRLWYWKTNSGISLSEVATSGLHNDSKVCTSVNSIWLQPIEIIPCTDEAIKDIESKDNYES